MVLISGSELNQWRQWAEAQAIAADISLGEINWFLQALTSATALDLKFGIGREITSQVNLAELTELWQQRIQKRIPLQYLVGKAPWRNFELIVTPDVLIPRPETEYLIDLAKDAAEHSDLNLATGHWVDLGTGSGAIALGLAEAFPSAEIYAVDQSQKALDVAKQNADIYKFANRIKFYQGSWWKPLSHLEGKVMGMISNPPYIPSAMLPSLQKEVFFHEPHSALDGGENGLADIQILIHKSPNYLISGGIWLIELMRGQGKTVAQFLKKNGCYTQIQIINDLSGGDRYVMAKKR
ncbi:protein-(glutamine-N5) methyltransferase, release factor-specific [[Leptolyngbya] sp. PCC 7376]|uniref:peptide chain release factor N(5)-glutamine methyltransferase n=1 Tax=[Leptolyngbya] sp. PCC 7376 TaxID=111781 RepID=UPI00029F40D3|nr:peptide chain release factor N(5)-glutamine methyltransferase [[Leptolyngbya] sp. PCC 7376]AFY39120.1 protein-(glutamine-N5) methyltransferase, release factor-specific [[Leptolyngbya] sp. PCC 7376]